MSTLAWRIIVPHAWAPNPILHNHRPSDSAHGGDHGTLRRRLMPQKPHELAQVWECLQRLDHADDAFHVRRLEAAAGHTL